MNDARFEDGQESPLLLQASDLEDLSVVSSLVQDAVLPITEIRYIPRQRRLALLINRFRWEDGGVLNGQHSPERVQALLIIDDALEVASSGIDRAEKDTVLSILSLAFAETQDGAGEVLITLAGDGAIRAKVECLNLRLKDVTRPYRAPSGAIPSHDA
jgi:hypothetical protein